MTSRTSGWFVFLAAVGMMAGLIGAEVVEFEDWTQATEPRFVGTAFVHLGTVVAAFVAGRLVPRNGGVK